MGKDYNKITLETYDSPGAAATYENTTRAEVSGDMQDWILNFASSIPVPANILEVGSGTGRDYLFLTSKGYSVTPSDASLGFLEIMKSKGIENALKLNIVTDRLPIGYNAIFANAVLLHTDRESLNQVLLKVFEYLPSGGVFALSLKWGEGEEVTKDKLSRERYFCYWDIESNSNQNILTLLKNVGWKIIEARTDKFIQPKGKQIGWLSITVQKP